MNMRWMTMALLLAAAGTLCAARSAEASSIVAAGPSVVVSIAGDGTIRVDSAVVRGDAAILAALRAAVARGKTHATVACDKNRPYGEVIHVVDLCRQAGIAKIDFAVDVTPNYGPSITTLLTNKLHHRISP